VRTQLERIAEKSRRETNFQFTSLAHHLTPELIWSNLNCIPVRSATGIDGKTVTETKETFDQWIDGAISSIHRKSYKAPAVRRVYIPKPGKEEKRPIGVPTVMDRAIQRSVAEVLSYIYEQDFLDCSFGGRPNLSAHKALCTFNELVAGKKVSYVYECDLKNFFGSLNHGWLEQFIKLRVGDPRILKLVKSWLNAGVMEDGERKASTIGTPQGGSISVLLSNIYLHYVLDLWFAKVVKPRLRGEAYLVRYLDDFVVCFQYREDAEKFEKVLPKRLARFSLELEPTKTRLVEFGRFSQKWAKKKGKRLETVYFLGFTHYCCRNRKGNFQVGRKTEKTRLKRFVAKLQEVMFIVRHRPLSQQRIEINQMLRGFYAYYGMGGNLPILLRTSRLAERLWRRALSSRSQRGNITWEKFNSIKTLHPLQRPRLYVPYSLMKSLAVL
jgi:RNA-directed DNA polymerase